MFARRICALILFGSMFSGLAEAEDSAVVVETDLNGQHFSVRREYVMALVREGGREKPQLWVAFSIPSFEPLGLVPNAEGRLQFDAAKRNKLRAAGEDIVELRLQPDELLSRRRERNFVERWCRKLGQFENVDEAGIKGYSCILSSGFTTTYFPIVARSGRGILSCKKTQTPPTDHCELLADGHRDGISRLLYVDRNSLPKLAALLDSAETFIQEKMKGKP